MDPTTASSTVDTRYWHWVDDERIQCDVCPRACKMREGQRGLCFVRGHVQGSIKLLTYGRSSGFCIDPIEKKPLNHFLPGTPVLSFGTAGCNLACKFCFHPETLVATTTGMRRIADLFDACEERVAHHDGWVAFPASLEVWTRAASRARVAKIFAHPYCGELLSIKASGCPPMLLTPNHRVFAARRSNPADVHLLAAEQLTAEHYLVVPKRQPGAGYWFDVGELLDSLDRVAHSPRLRRVPGLQLITSLSGTGTSAELGEALGYHPAYIRKLRGELARGALIVDEPRTVRVRVESGRARFLGERGAGLPECLELTTDFAWLLGFYCAEGCAIAHRGRPNSYLLTFCCGHHEQHLVERTARLLTSVLSARAVITNRRTTVTVDCASTSAARLFEALCGSGARNKRVPAQLAQSPEPVIRAFLEGYFAGDGHVAETHVVGTTVSRDLAMGLYELGLHLNLLPTFFVHEPAPTKRIEGREVTQLTTYIVKFKRDRYEMRTGTGSERTSWRDSGDAFLAPVRHIERVPYEGTVYNLEVDDPDHSYLAPFIAVSNCQNWDISKSREIDTLADRASPEELARTAVALDCASVAFTYNDPVVFMEYAIDVAKACREVGVKSVAVTAGYMCPEPRAEFYRYMDAANVDLKGFTERFYYKICGGELKPVLETLEYLKHETQVWFEITTLLIPGENDSEKELDQLSSWVMERLGPDVPLHFTAFHPDWKMLDKESTPSATLTRAREIAMRNGLHYVYTGNVHDRAGGSTWCHKCGSLLIERDWYELGDWGLDPAGNCANCGEPLPGVFAGRPGKWGRSRRPVILSRNLNAGT
jgi:pyruvate formate lyase activating enzyme